MAPELGYRITPRDPHLVTMRAYVTQKIKQTFKPGGPADDSGVKANRHHGWPSGTLSQHHVEPINRVRREIASCEELALVELCVIHIE